MTIEIILDILLSAVILYVYHSDCKPAPIVSKTPKPVAKTIAEFAIKSLPAEDYEAAAIPAIVVADEWLLDADESVDAVAALPGIPLTDTATPMYTREELEACTLRALRLMCKAVGIKNCSRLSKAAIVESLAAYYESL